MLSARRVGTHAAARLASASAPITIVGVVTPASGIRISITDWKPASVTPTMVPSAVPAPSNANALPATVASTCELSRPERHANTDLARAARDHEREQRVDRDDRQQQRHHAERRHRRGHARKKRTLLPANVFEQPDAAQVGLRIDLRHGPAERTCCRVRIACASDREVQERRVIRQRHVYTSRSPAITGAHAEVRHHADDLAPSRVDTFTRRPIGERPSKKRSTNG